MSLSVCFVYFSTQLTCLFVKKNVFFIDVTLLYIKSVKHKRTWLSQVASLHLSVIVGVKCQHYITHKPLSFLQNEDVHGCKYPVSHYVSVSYCNDSKYKTIYLTSYFVIKRSFDYFLIIQLIILVITLEYIIKLLPSQPPKNEKLIQISISVINGG